MYWWLSKESTIATCPKIIAKGYNNSEIQAWQDAGKTVTVIE